MRKKVGKQYTLYLPEDLMRRIRLVADEQDRSTSFVVACALKAHFNQSVGAHNPLSDQGVTHA